MEESTGGRGGALHEILFVSLSHSLSVRLCACVRVGVGTLNFFIQGRLSKMFQLRGEQRQRTIAHRLASRWAILIDRVLWGSAATTLT